MARRIPDCPLATAVELLGDWTTLELLHDAMDGRVHVEDFRRSLRWAPDVVVARLDALTEAGLFERRACPESPSTDDYVPTDLGRGVRPVLLALVAWSNSQLRSDSRSLVLVDSRTGRHADPVLVDRATGERADTPHYVFAAGPGASEAMKARYPDRPSACT